MKNKESEYLIFREFHGRYGPNILVTERNHKMKITYSKSVRA